MPVRNPSRLVDFDAERALSIARERASDQLLACAAYTRDDFEVIYLADDLVDRYDDDEAIQDVAENLHSYVNLDFEERALFQDLYPFAERTYAFSTYTDYVVAVRVLDTDEGLYLSFEHGADVEEIVDAVAPVVRGEE